MGASDDSGGEDGTEELIRRLDEASVLETLEAESAVASSSETKRRIQKRLLDDLGLFDVGLDGFDLSDDLRNRGEYLKYVNVDSDVSKEYSEEVERRLRELGFDGDEA